MDVKAPAVAAGFLAAAALLGGCNPGASGPPAAAVAAAPATGGPAGCSGEVSRLRAVIGNDVSVGHLSQAVYTRASADLDRAAQVCASGREAESRSLLAAARTRYGYP